jgi:hypothetical protein
MTFYVGLAATASRLLQDKGQQITVTRSTGGTFDPVTGSASGESVTQFTAYGAVFDYTVNQRADSSIQAGDKRVLMESGNAPKISDTITTADGDSTCIDFKVLAPAGEVVLYELQVRY